MGRGTVAAAAALLLVVVPVVHDGAVVALAAKAPQVGLGGGKGVDGVPFQGVQPDGGIWGAGRLCRPGGVAGAGVGVVHRHPGIAEGQFVIEGNGLDGAFHRLADLTVHLHGDGGLEVIGAHAAVVVQVLEIAAGQAADAVLQASGQDVLIAVKGGVGGAALFPARLGAVVILRANELRVAAVLVHTIPLVGDGILAAVEIGRFALGQRAGFGAEAGLEAVGVQGVSAGQAGFAEVGILVIAAEPLIAAAEAGFQSHALVRAVGGGVDHQHRGQGLGVHGLVRAALVHKGGDVVIKAQLVAAAQSEGQLLRRIIDAAAVIHGLLPQQQLRQLLAAVCLAADVALMAGVIGPHPGEDDGGGVVGGAAAVQGQLQRRAGLPPGQVDHRAQAVGVAVVVIGERNRIVVLVRAAQGDDTAALGGRLRHRGGVVEPIDLHLGVGAAVGVLAVAVDELHGLFIVRRVGRPGQIDLCPVGHRHQAAGDGHALSTHRAAAQLQVRNAGVREGVHADELHRRGHIQCRQRGAALEGAVADAGQAAGQLHRGEVGAVGKGAFADALDLCLGQVDGLDGRTFIESVVVDDLQGSGQLVGIAHAHAHQIGASAEGVLADAVQIAVLGDGDFPQLSAGEHAVIKAADVFAQGHIAGHFFEKAGPDFPDLFAVHHVGDADIARRPCVVRCVILVIAFGVFQRVGDIFTVYKGGAVWVFLYAYDSLIAEHHLHLRFSRRLGGRGQRRQGDHRQRKGQKPERQAFIDCLLHGCSPFLKSLWRRSCRPIASEVSAIHARICRAVRSPIKYPWMSFSSTALSKAGSFSGWPAAHTR